LISATASVEIDRPVPEVFAFVADPANEPSWHTDIVSGSLEPVGPPGPGKVVHLSFRTFGQRVDGLADVAAFEPNRMIVYAAREAYAGLRFTNTYLFEPSAGGTRFTRHAELEPKGIVRLLERMMRGQIAKRNARFTQNLKRRLESAS
jgi:uncharacterized protein YndB with AHSA1/START domain